MPFNLDDLPFNIKELAVHAVNADPQTVSWDEFKARCVAAGYQILDENPDSNEILIVHEEG